MEIYIIKKGELFYDIKSKYFARLAYLGTIFKTSKQAQMHIKKDKLENVEISTITEEYFMTSLAAKTTKLIIQLDVVARDLDEIRCILPTNDAINKVLNQNIKTTSKKIKNATSFMFSEFAKQKEDATYDVLGFYENYINELSKVEMYEVNDVANLLKARRKSPKSFSGLIKKIL